MDQRYDPSKVEPEISALWEKEQTYKFHPESSKPVFSIDTPPPTVSGRLHLGHVFSYSQAEFMARFKRMAGYEVFYPFGLDNNGLPTELLVEKELGKTAEEMGRSQFVEAVRKTIKKYNEAYVRLFTRLGLSVDWTLLYETVNDEVQKISQTSFLELVKAGRAVRREAPVLFCPKCKTTVSQMELKDKKIKTKLVYVKFSDSLTIATTRPELLPACVAVFVNPSDSRYTGSVGKEVDVPLFGYKVKVIADSRVDPSYGTGAVMCCTFGDQTDIEWYKAYNLPLKMIVLENGKINHPVYGELGVKQAREKIVEDLTKAGLVAKTEEIEHSVNVHERCDTEIEFTVRKQWYIRYLDLKQQFLEQGDKINWYPGYMKVRYTNWVNGLQWDWNISRQRFFGVYFPVWYCVECGEPVFAKLEELPVDPTSRAPSEACRCGSSKFVPDYDVMDTWATSSLTPLINGRWGLDSKYMNKIYPMSLRTQAHDIISFWAFTTIVKSYLHTGTIPWKDIMISGHGLDPKGQPMHKSKGNIIYPEPYIEKYGADALRFWASSSTLGEDNSFQEKDVVSGSRLLNKLWNVARYVSLNCLGSTQPEPQAILDKWILNRLAETAEAATQFFERYDYYKARVKIEEFFWEFANDYLEFVKNRVYAGDQSSRRVMSWVLLNVVKMLAPYVPYITDYIYRKVYFETGELQNLGVSQDISVHTSAWPKNLKKYSEEAQTAQLIADSVREIRRIKHDNKLPLNENAGMVVIHSRYREQIEPYTDEIVGAIKVKSLRFDGVGETKGLISSFEP
ncbi:MAG: valine--tRNA ligase [Thermoprotei archaeon]